VVSEKITQLNEFMFAEDKPPEIKSLQNGFTSVVLLTA
jgi:hypothetical protein